MVSGEVVSVGLAREEGDAMPKGNAIKSYKDLDVWLMAMALAESCYRATRNFPREETYGMTAQIRRASASIPANIAEGYGRDQTGGFIQFLRIAQGSTREGNASHLGWPRRPVEE
jgi:23S rRNA-intervening sequence protein